MVYNNEHDEKVVEPGNSQSGVPEFPDDAGSPAQEITPVQTPTTEEEHSDAGSGATKNEPIPVKRGRGRPRKINIPDTPTEFSPGSELQAEKPVKRNKTVTQRVTPKIPYATPLTDAEQVLPNSLVCTVEIVCVKLFGDDLRFNDAEKSQLVDVWGKYFRSMGLVDLPPGWLAAITTGLIIAPKLGTENSRVRIKHYYCKLTGKPIKQVENNA